MRVADNSGRLLLLKAAPDLHWHSTVCVVASSGRGRPIHVLTLGREAEIDGVIVATSVAVTEAILVTLEREFVLVAELGH